MKVWYKGEAFRLLPNIEIYYDEEGEAYCFTLVWMKLCIDLPIAIRWKRR